MVEQNPHVALNNAKEEARQQTVEKLCNSTWGVQIREHIKENWENAKAEEREFREAGRKSWLAYVAGASGIRTSRNAWLDNQEDYECWKSHVSTKSEEHEYWKSYVIEWMRKPKNIEWFGKLLKIVESAPKIDKKPRKDSKKSPQRSKTGQARKSRAGTKMSKKAK